MSKIVLEIDIDSLEAGFDICFLIRDHCENVIASGEYGESDIENRDKASKFIGAFNSAVKKHNRLTRKYNKLKLNKLQRAVEKLTLLSDEVK